MDSVTQFLLGASITGAILGPRVGVARSLVIGGTVATLPDLDTFVPFIDPIEAMTHHRGFSHSFLVQTLVAPVIMLLIAFVSRRTRDHKRLVLLAVWLTLTTHSLLDSLTSYGTQVLWPFEVAPPLAIPAVFIIDPLYTLLLLAGVAAAFVTRNKGSKGLSINRGTLALSTAYLCLGVVLHTSITARAEADPRFQDMKVHVQPTPFNILVWQVLGVSDTAVTTGLTGPLDRCTITALSRRDRLKSLPGYTPPPSVQRLEWFTDGFFSYDIKGQYATITDLRMGYPPDFVFSFRIAELAGSGPHPIEPTRLRLDPTDRLTSLAGMWENALEGCIK
ncbi:metal-dependent hydrolase [Sneathiella chinensis]|uniref:Hydrolase n=1 Tax=Sneathiella chinensis TaxID=349750 RepID=A0ABQ5U833_9PROT|nr:metal-dependent hydrolase [Sneathiella chinensis]GLQ07895.1 hydrolase [Sneathiella chinensis]